MTEPPIRLAVIGLGMASKPHLAALKQLSPKVEVAGIFTRNETRRSEFASAWGWPEYSSVEEVAGSDAHGAIIITPPNARMEIVSKLASAGKALLMEKPVERDLEKATALVELCEERAVPLAIVLQHRFRAGAEALAKHIASGVAGKIHMVRVNLPWWREQSYYDQPGRGTYEVDGGGVLITQAIHVLDLMLSLTGPVTDVSALTGTTGLHQMEAEDFAVAGLSFQNGAVGSVVATTSAFPGGSESLEIDCENASMKLIAGELTICWRDGRTETVGELTGTGGGGDPMDFPCDWHRDLIDDFAGALISGSSPRVTGRQALNVHRLIEAMERSARTATRVEVVGVS